MESKNNCTFWQNIITRTIYKYEHGTKPFRAEEWKEVSASDYTYALSVALERSKRK